MTNPLARLGAVLATAALLLTVLPGSVTSAGAAPVEDYARYDGQSTCADEVLPGTEFLLRHLVRTHPGTRAVSTLRACSGSSTSEHKDGRALDWGVDADVPREKALADAWLERIFATDRRGNTHALARRMGIMYVIWDDRIYSAYNGFQERLHRPCERLADCSKTARHRDHVHVSLSRAGAAAQTSFYRARGVPSVPVLLPGTDELDPVATAEATFTVPADGTVVRTDFDLTAGQSYRIVADGLVRTGGGSRVADAACRWGRRGWVPNGPLLVGGTNPWPATCSDGHTYDTSYTPTRTGPLELRVDRTRPRLAEGALTFSILRADLPAPSVASRRPASSPEPRAARRAGKPARALVKEAVTVRAAARGGALTKRAVRVKHRYRIVVTGAATSGSTAFDGQCVRYAGRWWPQHTLDLTTPDADHLSLYVQGVKVRLRAAGTSRPCNARTHRYVGSFRPVVKGRARIKVWDPLGHADNAGALTVLVKRR